MYEIAATFVVILAVSLTMPLNLSGQDDPFATDINIEPDPFAIAKVVNIGSEEVKEAPGNLTAWRKPEFIGKSFDFRITGTTTGTIYGTDVYTDDSNLATAAVHAGLVEPGQTAVVRVTILPGRNSYRSTELNGITSRSYKSWGGSYMIDAGDKPEGQVNVSAKTPRTMSGIEGEIGQSFEYVVTGSVSGYVWGADVYTDDSTIAAAAVHAGALEPGQTDTVKVTLLPSRSFYNGSDRNGVTTSSYGSFRRSYMIDRVTKSRGLDPFSMRTP